MSERDTCMVMRVFQKKVLHKLMWTVVERQLLLNFVTNTYLFSPYLSKWFPDHVRVLVVAGVL